MNIIKSLQIEFFVILGILFFGAIMGYQECINFWKMDIGFCIAAIGAIWVIASFFRLYSTIPHNLSSLGVGGSIFILGFGIHEYGFFTALIMLGVMGLYVSSMSQPIFPKVANIIFIISLILLPLGLALKSIDKPTDPDKYYHSITCNDIKWGAFVYYENESGENIGTNLGYIVGNEELAYKQTREIVKKWKDKNPSLKIQEVQVRIPDDLYTEAYNNGYVPTHILLNRYPKGFLPSWSALQDLCN